MNPPVTPSRPYAKSLSGLVERVTYFNEENGFAVLKVKVKGHREPVTIVDFKRWVTDRVCSPTDRLSGETAKSSLPKPRMAIAYEVSDRHYGKPRGAAHHDTATRLIPMSTFSLPALVLALCGWLAVALPAVATDSFEPDNTPEAATVLVNGEAQSHSIHVAGDVDWFRFTLPVPGWLRLETYGPPGDSEMWLFGPNSSSTQLDYDDDDGDGTFSLLVRTNGTELDAGTYHVKVASFGTGTVPSYFIRADWGKEPLAQTLTWLEPASNATLLINKQYPLTVTASSGLPVAFRVESGPAIVMEGAVMATNAGTIRLVAEQAGNETYAPTSLERIFNQGAFRIASAGQWPHFSRGDAHDVQVVGSLAYAALGDGGLAIFDVSQPSAPAPVGGFDTSGNANGLQVVGNMAFVADGAAGLQIVDVANPAVPIRLGGYDTGGTAEGVHVVGNLAYIADGLGGVEIVDVSNPANPTPVGGLVTSGAAQDIQVAGTFAYVADGSAGVQILDVSDPKAPLRLGAFDTGGFTEAVQVVGNLLYVAADKAGLQIVKVSNPAVPVRVSRVETFGAAKDVHVVGTMSYVAIGAEFVAFDVSNPAAPIPVGSVTTSGNIRAVQVVGDLAYYASATSGLRVLDITNPTTPVGVGGYDTKGVSSDVQVVGTLAYVADGEAGLQILDVSNPAAPVRVGRYNTGGSALSVQVKGNLAYVADWDGGLSILNVSNPALPVSAGRYPFYRGVRDVQVVGTLAYAVDIYDGLLVFDVSSPSNIWRVGSNDIFGRGSRVQVVGSLAFVATGSDGLLVFDVTNPATPVQVSNYRTVDNVEAVTVVDNLAYLAVAGAGLEILDVSDPAKPLRLGRYDTTGVAYEVQVVRNLAYVAGDYGGLDVLDVSDPTTPVSVGNYTIGGNPRGLWVNDDVAYVADGALGLQVLQLRERLVQTLSFDPPARVTLEESPLILSATTSSELPITFSVVSGPATVDGNRLSLIGPGVVVVRAEQPGNNQFSAKTVDRTITATKAAQVLAWTSPTTNTILHLNERYLLTATSSSGLPVTFKVERGPAKIDNGHITATNVGTVVLTAEQSGDSVHAAVQTTRTLNRSEIQLREIGQWPGIPRGEAKSVFVRDSTAFVGIGRGGMAIIDITNPNTPIRRGTFTTTNITDATWNLQVVGSLAYLATGESGLHIVDVSDQSTPRLVGRHDTSYAWALQTVGNLAFVADRTAGLLIVDVSNPSQPVTIGTFDTEGDVQGVQVVGHLAYLADSASGLRIVDISNPSAPTLVATYTTGGSVLAMQVGAGLAYLADGRAGLTILDVSNPFAPLSVGSYDTVGAARGVQVKDNIAFVADGGGGLQIIDVSTPANPVRVSTRGTLGSTLGLYVSGEFVYLADSVAGLEIVGVSNLAEPTVRWSADIGRPYDIHVASNVVYVATFNGLRTFDVQHPAEPIRLGDFTSMGSGAVQVVGNVAYLGGSGLQVLDVTDPARPALIGDFKTPEAVSCLKVVGNLAYVSSGLQLLVLDVSNPNKPEYLGALAMSRANALEVVGHRLYASVGSIGIEVVDIGSSLKPEIIGRFHYANDGTASANALRVSGNIAYVAAGAGGLQILDVSDPGNIVQIGGLTSGKSQARDVQLVRNLAFVTEEGRVDVLDVRDPTAPEVLRGFNPLGLVFDGTAVVRVVSNLVCVASRVRGLQTLDWREGIPQSLTYNLLSETQLGGGWLSMVSTASSGLPVSFSVISGPATISGDQLTTTGVGRIVVRAEQAGNSQFLPVSLERTINVLPPRLTVSQSPSGGALLLSVGTTMPPGSLVESSSDLRSWQIVAPSTLNTDGTGFVVPLADPAGQVYFRIRFP